ncbi:MAG TPA: hypothetical protein VK524_34535 [Polyangiaceae bacterium]|nr:hypothetical protein [Polyangiaceae bacterium]
MSVAAKRVQLNAVPALRLVRQRRPSRAVAAEHLLMLINEIGEDMGWAWGWKAEAARQLGIGVATVAHLTLGYIDTIGTRVIDQVCAKIGVTVAEFMEET